MKNKYCKKYILYNWIRSLYLFIPLIFVIISNFLEGEEIDFEKLLNNWIYIVLGFICYIIITLVINILVYHNIKYVIEKDSIQLNRGIIFKKRLVLNYQNIHGITTTQTLLMQILGIVKIAIDSGNVSTSGEDEIVIIQSKKESEKIEKYVKSIIQKEEIKEETTFDYAFTKKKMFDYCFFSVTNAFLFILTLVIFTICIIVCLINKEYLMLLLSAIFCSIGYVIIFSIMYLSIYLKYYNFTITDSKKNLKISYGLIKKRNLLIEKNKIKIVEVIQDVVMKKKRLARISIEVIGLNNIDNNDEKESKNADLIPLCMEEEVKMFLSRYLKSYELVDNEISPKKGTLYLFMEISFLIITIIALLFTIFIVFIKQYVLLFVVIGIYLLTILIMTLLKYLEMKHNKLAYDDETVCITKGIFEIKTSIYKWDNIISIEKSETILREKANVSIIYLYNYCNHTNSSGQIKMVDNEIFDLLEEKIKK